MGHGTDWYLVFGVSKLNGEGAVEATLRFCANPKHAIAASVGGFDGFFEILHRRHHEIVHLHDDNALCDSGILEFSGFDAADQKTIAQTQFALLVVGQYSFFLRR